MGTSNIPVGVQAGSPPVWGPFRGDTRYRAVGPASVPLQVALVSLGVDVPIPQQVANQQSGGYALDYDVFVIGAAGAVTGINFFLAGGASSGLCSVLGPGAAITTPRIDGFVTNTLSPAYATFDISGIVVISFKVGVRMTGMPRNTPNLLSLQAQNAGAGLYTVVSAIVTAYQL